MSQRDFGRKRKNETEETEENRKKRKNMEEHGSDTVPATPLAKSDPDFSAIPFPPSLFGFYRVTLQRLHETSVNIEDMSPLRFV